MISRLQFCQQSRQHILLLILVTFSILFSIFFIVLQIQFFKQVIVHHQSSPSSFLDVRNQGNGFENFIFNNQRSDFSNEVSFGKKENHDHDIAHDIDQENESINDAQNHFVQNTRIAIVIPILESYHDPTVFTAVLQSIQSIQNTLLKKDCDRILSISILVCNMNEDNNQGNSKMQNQEIAKLRRFINDIPIPVNVEVLKSKTSSNHRGCNAFLRNSVNKIQDQVTNLERDGLKSTYEDITLLFIKPGAEILTNGWVDIVTSVLRGTTMMVTDHQNDQSEGTDNDDGGGDSIIQPANAISFAVQGASFGETYSFDIKHSSIIDTSIANSRTKHSSDYFQSYPTPVLEGSITAMKLQTYLSFPVKDTTLSSFFALNLEMSFNLWMCGDGIDIVPRLRAKQSKLFHAKNINYDTGPDGDFVNINQMISLHRLLGTWIDGDKALFASHTGIDSNKMKTANQNLSIKFKKLIKLHPLPPTKFCRDYVWYMENVNSFSDELQHEILTMLKPIIYSSKGRLKNGINLKEKGEKDQLPQKPLDKAKLNMISNVIPIDVTYDGGKRAPKKESKQSQLKSGRRSITRSNKRYVGIPEVNAYDDNNKDNYVHNVTSLRQNRPKFDVDNLDDICSIHDETWKLLTEKISIDLEGHDIAQQNVLNGGKPRAKIMCIIYTIEPFHDRIPIIRETWGQKCDGFMVASNRTESSLDIVKISHSGPEDYGHVWSKVQAIWSYVYDHHYEDFDWFHIGGDDLYLLVENLRLFVESEEVQLLSNGGTYLPNGNEKYQFPISLGLRFTQGRDIFNTGGSGYTMNKAALKTLVTKANSKDLSKASSAEDLYLSRVLKRAAHLVPIDTCDEYNDPRYHHFNVSIVCYFIIGACPKIILINYNTCVYQSSLLPPLFFMQSPKQCIIFTLPNMIQKIGLQNFQLTH